MLHVLFFVECVEMSWKGFRPNSLDNLCLNSWSRLHFKSLESLLVRSFRLKFLRFILAQANHGVGTLSNRLQHLVMLFQFFLLFLIEVLFIIRFTFKWQWIERILRMFFMKYIILTIFPIGETLLIRWKSNNRLFIVTDLFKLLDSRTNFEIFKSISRSGFHVHLMRIDDFTFFF